MAEKASEKTKKKVAEKLTEDTTAPSPDAPGVATPGSVLPTADACVHSEMLCFMQNKSSLLAFDQLAKIVADFYNKEEVMAARHIVEKYMPAGPRLTRRQGDNIIRATVEDLLKVVLNPQVKLPTFYAVEMGRLPPVDVTNCDVSAILRELQALRSEVRASAILQDEVTALRCELVHLREEVANMQQKGVCNTALLDAGMSEMSTKVDDTHSTTESFANKAAELKKSGMAVRPKRRVAQRCVIGASADNKHVASVKTSRTVEIFVSRCHPHTAGSMLAECVNMTKGDLDVQDVTCEKLKSRYEYLYSSFHVQVRVASTDFKKALELFMSAEAWPSDLLVKRYFPVKHGGD